MASEENQPPEQGLDGQEDTQHGDKGKQPAVESEEEDDIPVLEAGDEAADATAASTATKKKKKKSKRKKVKDALTGKSVDPLSQAKTAMDTLPDRDLVELMQKNPALVQELQAASGSNSAESSRKLAEEFKKLDLNEVLTGMSVGGKNAKDMASYKFWQTQPVPRFDDEIPKEPIQEGPMKEQTVEETSTEAAKLMLPGFEWVTMDLTKDAEIKEVYELLNGHYVEDDESMFRFNYGTEILKWALLSPGWKKEWQAGIRDCRQEMKQPLVAFISAVPLELRIREKVIHSSEVNFLCIHKKLRSKRLAPVLIKEITRRCNLEGVFQAVYTAGVVLPKPISTCRYYHRALNWKKLHDVGFSPLPRNSRPEWQIRKFQLPDRTSVKGLREMQAKDVSAVQSLLKRYLVRYDMVPEWTREEIEHWLLPKKSGTDEQVVWSYVVEDPESKKITDFFSFYNLESTVINNRKHNTVKVAYLFYYATETGLTEPLDRPVFKARLNELMGDALILAKKADFDVFNALSLMDNALFLADQKFGPGDGQLNYYLFNYRANPIRGGIDANNQADEDALSGIGFVML